MIYKVLKHVFAIIIRVEGANLKVSSVLSFIFSLPSKKDATLNPISLWELSPQSPRAC